MSKADFLEAAIINHVLRGMAMPTFAASVWAALHSAFPGEDGNSNELAIGTAAYVRTAITRATTAWVAPTEVSGAQTSSNVAAVTFPAPTAPGWGYIGFGSLKDAATAGNSLYVFPIGPKSELAAGITAAATTLTVLSAAAFPASGQFVIIIDSEKMLVTAGAGTTTWTVTRAFDGSVAAIHNAAAWVVQPRLIQTGDSAPSFAIAALSIGEA